MYRTSPEFEVPPAVQEVDAVGKVLLEAADIIEKRGWCRGAFDGPSGELCIVGAVLAATGTGGPWQEAHRRLMRLGRSMGWNDAICASKDDAVQALRSAATAR